MEDKKKKKRREPATYPAGAQELAPKLFRGIVEGEFLAAEMVDGRVALQVEEEVVVETDFLRLFLQVTAVTRWNRSKKKKKKRNRR